MKRRDFAPIADKNHFMAATASNSHFGDDSLK
jgi:hypothetical protein